MSEEDRETEEIQEITNRLRAASLETLTLTEQLQRITSRRARQQQPSPTIPRQLAVGDWVVITNNHRGLRGTIGQVHKIHQQQVTIRTPEGVFYNRGKQNVQQVPAPLNTP
jgi:preprotein translocase subunit YajC